MLKVKSKCCGKCLFGKNKLVTENRKSSILNGCSHMDAHFECHEGTLKGEKIVCAGFYKKHSSQGIRIAQRLNMVKMVD